MGELEVGIVQKQEPPPLSVPPPVQLKYESSYLRSFTSMARKQDFEPAKQIESEQFTIHTLPRGAETGSFLHQLFEDIFSSSQGIWREPQALAEFVLKKSERFAPWKEAIRDLALQVAPLFADLEPSDIRVEVEFLFEDPPHFVKGFVDLVFQRGGKIYFLDWKSNWLGENDEAYSKEALQAAMKTHDYELQAALYAEALKRSFGEFGGAYYIFLRGLNAPSKGTLFYDAT